MEGGNAEAEVLSYHTDSEISTIDDAEEANEHSFASLIASMRDIQKSISNDRHLTKSKKESIMDSLDSVMIKMVEELASRSSQHLKKGNIISNYVAFFQVLTAVRFFALGSNQEGIGMSTSALVSLQ